MLGFARVAGKESFGSKGSGRRKGGTPGTSGEDGGRDPRLGIRGRLSWRRSPGRACSVDHQAVGSSGFEMGRTGGGVELRSQECVLFFRRPQIKSKETWDCPAAARPHVQNLSGQQRRRAAQSSCRFISNGRQKADSFEIGGAIRIRHQVAPVWLPGVWKLCSQLHGICLSANLSKKYAQRPLRRNKERSMRSGRQALHLG